MSNTVYEAAVYTRDVTYRNYNGVERTTTLFFSLDPLSLLEVIAANAPKTIKSGNPAKNGQPGELSDQDQIRLIRELAVKASGVPSADGETWERLLWFDSDIVGQAFLTQLTSSAADRREFSERVILAPFRAFVKFAVSDPSNTKDEVKMFNDQLAKLENIFKTPEVPNETLEEKKARLAAEMAELEKQGNVTPLPLPHSDN